MPNVLFMDVAVGFDEKPANDGSIGECAYSTTAYTTTTTSSFMSIESIHGLANEDKAKNTCKRQKSGPRADGKGGMIDGRGGSRGGPA